MKQIILAAALTVLSTVAVAKPNAIALQPVLSITTTNGMTRIVGNMPLPVSVPADHKQTNAVIFPASPNADRCIAMAQDSMATGKGFQIAGESSTLYAVDGVFTMQLTSVTKCIQF
ncbi:MAG: hypothetical protein V4736_02300 [Bdellovibrionota bacterium]